MSACHRRWWWSWIMVAMCCLIALPAQAQQADSTPEAIRAELAKLRQEFDAVRQQYGDRLNDLENRLAELEAAKQGSPPAAPAVAPEPATAVAEATPPAPPEGAQAAPSAAPPTSAQVPTGAEGAGGPSGSLPVYGNVNLMSKIFNPDVAVIGDFLGAAGSNTINPQPALEMHEAEASFQAVVDPYARADFFLSFGPEGAEIEEGFISFPTVPGGLNVKVGKMRAGFGKVNAMHTHVLPWTDRPLVTENLVGGDEGISDSGVSAARIIPIPWFFLEATGEVYRGESEVFSTHTRGDLTYVGRLRAYQDINEASNVDVGGSFAYGKNDLGSDFATRLVGFDLTYRYRPLRRAIYRRFIARTEMIWSRRDLLASRADSVGGYLSGDYQFARRWFGGLRFDYSDRADNDALHDKGMSALVTYWPSEFSQIRGQYRRIRYAEQETANEFLFQFLFSIGAHGAHSF
jgi:hypothetical protein